MPTILFCILLADFMAGNEAHPESILAKQKTFGGSHPHSVSKDFHNATGSYTRRVLV